MHCSLHLQQLDAGVWFVKKILSKPEEKIDELASVDNSDEVIRLLEEDSKDKPDGDADADDFQECIVEEKEAV